MGWGSRSRLWSATERRCRIHRYTLQPWRLPERRRQAGCRSQVRFWYLRRSSRRRRYPINFPCDSYLPLRPWRLALFGRHRVFRSVHGSGEAHSDRLHARSPPWRQVPTPWPVVRSQRRRCTVRTDVRVGRGLPPVLDDDGIRVTSCCFPRF